MVLFFIIDFYNIELAISSGTNARSGAEGAGHPGDVRLAPTGAERRPQVPKHFKFLIF